MIKNIFFASIVAVGCQQEVVAAPTILTSMIASVKNYKKPAFIASGALAVTTTVAGLARYCWMNYSYNKKEVAVTKNNEETERELAAAQLSLKEIKEEHELLSGIITMKPATVDWKKYTLETTEVASEISTIDPERILNAWRIKRAKMKNVPQDITTHFEILDEEFRQGGKRPDALYILTNILRSQWYENFETACNEQVSSLDEQIRELNHQKALLVAQQNELPVHKHTSLMKLYHGIKLGYVSAVAVAAYGWYKSYAMKSL